VVCRFIEENEPDLGWFDFVGHDRRALWEELGDMSKTDAMEEFVKVLEENVEGFPEWIKLEREKIAEQEKLERERLEMERLERERAFNMCCF
jgi:hypothetical protein